MNGYDFKDKELDEDRFGAKAGNIVSAFDAFRKSTPQEIPRLLGVPLSNGNNTATTNS